MAEAAWFDLVEWVEEAPGVRAKVDTIGAARWALVEYEPGAGRSEWCTEGPHGFVLAGAIHIDWWEPLGLDSRVSIAPVGRQIWPCPPEETTCH